MLLKIIKVKQSENGKFLVVHAAVFDQSVIDISLSLSVLSQNETPYCAVP